MKNLEDFKETIRLKKNKLSAHLLVVSGKEYDSYVLYAPTLNLSGYGNTKKEAHDMLKESFEDFAAYFMGLTFSEKELYLTSHGFSKEKFKTKNFSKAYIDEEGELQNLSLEDKKCEITNLVA